MGVLVLLGLAMFLGWMRVRHQEGPHFFRRQKIQDLEKVELPAADAALAGLVARELGTEREQPAYIDGEERMEIDGDQLVEAMTQHVEKNPQGSPCVDSVSLVESSPVPSSEINRSALSIYEMP